MPPRRKVILFILQGIGMLFKDGAKTIFFQVSFFNTIYYIFTFSCVQISKSGTLTDLISVFKICVRPDFRPPQYKYKKIVKNHLKSRQKCPYFKWSSFWMVGTIAIAKAKSLTLWKPDYMKFDLEKVKISLMFIISLRTQTLT